MYMLDSDQETSYNLSKNLVLLPRILKLIGRYGRWFNPPAYVIIIIMIVMKKQCLLFICQFVAEEGEAVCSEAVSVKWILLHKYIKCELKIYKMLI